MILLVDLQMLGELIDRRGENGDLDIGGTGVGSRMTVLGRDFGLLFFAQGHVVRAPCSRMGSLRVQARSVRPGDRGIIPEVPARAQHISTQWNRPDRGIPSKACEFSPWLR